MSDKLTPEQRHHNMAAIRAKDTKPEILVRKYLWSHGFRYRLNHPRLPGKPDIVLRKYRTCVFVNGCFWHGHELQYDNDNFPQSSECCKIPRSNTEFWVKKILRNKERDKEVQQKLLSMGWHSITLWECQLKPAMREKMLSSLAFTLNHIFLEHHKVKRYELPDEPLAMVAEDCIT
ncbi:MAG: very short patch repair endonuclease [Prevotellaceae bacterium]|nr:very short patch repair endonuclease [Prevotellaceae bacterium]